MPTTYRYQDFVDEQRKGDVHGVFIDDTGSPGLRYTPTNLHPKRKSWVAVIVPRPVLAETWNQLPNAIDELRNLTGATEFHFADIYAGRHEFKGVSLQKRLGIFGFMAHIFSSYNFPILVQTLDPKSMTRLRSQASLPDRIGPFNLHKAEDTALLLLILRVKWYLEGEYRQGQQRARLFVDEGFQRNGAAIALPTLKEVFCDGLICFAQSKSILPIQLADFAAFCLNRTQLLIGRPTLSELDRLFLQIVQPIAWNVQNIPVLPLGAWFPDHDPVLH
jgi:hypothetical protein